MIIDAFLFAWELDLLEIRLNELDPIVGKFVIVEALEPHGATGTRHPVLASNWQIVKPFEHKLKYVAVPHLEPPYTNRHDIWPRENFHRNSLMPSILEVCSSLDDIIMISDCDEIPRASTISQYLHELHYGVHSFNQDLFYYDVNNHLGKWHGTVAGTIKAIQVAGGLQAIRNRRDSWPSIENGGWHLSYFGGLERIRHKVQNFAHNCDDICQDFLSRDSKEIAHDIVQRNDLYHRPSEQQLPKWESNDSRLPSYFLNNVDKFRHFTEEGVRENLKDLL